MKENGGKLRKMKENEGKFMKTDENGCKWRRISYTKYIKDNK